MGFTYQMMQFQEERLWAAANAIESLSQLHPLDHRLRARAPDLRQERARPPGRALQARRAEDRGRGAARPGLHGDREVRRRRRRDRVGVDGQAQGLPSRPRGARHLHAVLGRHGLHLGQPGLAPVPRRPPRLDRRRRRRGDARHHRQVHAHAAGAARGSDAAFGPDRQPRRDRASAIARTARRLGIETIAVASDADRARAAHARRRPRWWRSAASAPPIPTCASTPIVAAARVRGAAAVHPGLRLPERERGLRGGGGRRRPGLDRPAAGRDARDGRQVAKRAGAWPPPACRAAGLRRRRPGPAPAAARSGAASAFR